MRYRQKQPGHTLAGTMVFLILVTVLWVGILRQMVGAVCVEKAFQKRLSFSQGSMKAMAWALTLLETGLPPANRYSCLLAIDEESGLSYVASFTKVGNLTYTVETRPATEDDIDLPQNPATFEQDNDDKGKGKDKDKGKDKGGKKDKKD